MPLVLEQLKPNDDQLLHDHTALEQESFWSQVKSEHAQSFSKLQRTFSVEAREAFESVLPEGIGVQLGNPPPPNVARVPKRNVQPST